VFRSIWVKPSKLARGPTEYLGIERGLACGRLLLSGVVLEYDLSGPTHQI
jgi:hypothetical protein